MKALLLVLLSAAPAKDFEAASERALAGDRAAAIGLYESLLEAGVEHEDLYFNLGNVLARDGRHLDAVIAYERALRLAPGDDDVRANLDTVRAEMLGEAAKGPPEELGLADVLDPLVSPLPAAPMTYAFLVANLLLVLLLIAVKKRAVIATVAAVTVMLGAVTAGHAIVAADPRGVVLESTKLKRGPHARYEERGEAETGTRVRVLEEEAGWLRVQNPDGTTGWLRERRVERL